MTSKQQTHKREASAPQKIEQIDAVAFRKLTPEKQMAELRGLTVERLFQVERDGIDEEKRTAWLSIASETPYERWWGIEVLSVDKKSIRAERLKMGAPLLVGHDPADQVGVVDSYEITGDRKLRILARFSKSERAQEIWQDVLDGIRRNTSVGYVIHELQLVKSEGDVNTYRVTDWEPLEGSLVSVPADPTVGVGRNLSPVSTKQELSTMENIQQQQQPVVDTAAVARAADEARRVEQERVNSILAAGDAYADMGGPAIARELVKDANANVDTFKARMLESLRGKQKPTQTAEPAPEQRTTYGSGVRVVPRYGQLRAFTKPLMLSNGQKMPAEEAAYRAGMWLAGAIYGKKWAQDWCRANGIDFYSQDDRGEVRVMTGGTNAAGGALVPVEMEQAIIDLRDMYGVARRLVRVRPMSSDVKQIPRRAGGLTAYFFTDDDGTGITASDKSWNQVQLVAKKLGVLARVGEDLEEDAIIDVVDDLAQEIAYAFAVKEDNCFINGDGTSTYGGMQGILVKLQGTAYASRITLASNHDTFAEVDASDLASVMAGVAAYGKPGAKWLCSATAQSLVFDRLKASAGGNDINSLAGGASASYLGYGIETSEAMPAGVSTDYSSLGMLMFGRFDLAASMGNRRGITLQVLRERYAELGQIGIKGTERFDLVVHDVGDTTNKGPVALAYGQ